eukprot:3699342-Pleurochrysis_carterae.AAC.1
MNGADALTIHKARGLIAESIVAFTEHMKDEGIDGTQNSWNHTWGECLGYAQRGGRGGTAKENMRIREETDEMRVREPYPTLYPGGIAGDAGTNRGTGRGRQNMGQLTDRARNNQHRQKRRNETQREKRMRLAKGENGTRVVSDVPERKIGRGSGKCSHDKRTSRQGDYLEDKIGEGHTECSKTTRWSSHTRK